MLRDEAGQSEQVLLALERGTWFSDLLIRGREAFLNTLTGVRPSLVVNKAPAEGHMPVQVDLAGEIKRSLDDLKASAMSDNGMAVDYASLRASPAYTEYQVECQAALRHFEPDSLPGEEARRAFWINLYNALVLDAVIAFGIEQSVTEGPLGILTFFRRAAYLVDGRRVSLEDIEHGILRANRGNPYLPGAHFASDDPRLGWSLPLDPRLHFALNCGGRSCPPIRSYSADRLDQQLDLVTQGYLTATVEIRPDRGELWLSRILAWYQRDFGGRQGLLAFLLHHLPEGQRRDYLLTSGDTLRLRYHAYDWQLNSI